MNPAATILLFLMCLSCSACGYLDEDIHVDDEAFEEGFEGVGGLSLSGYGTSGCGGGGYGFYTARSPHIRIGSVGSSSATVLRANMSMSDAEILEHTDVDIIDEQEALAPPNLVEVLYFSAIADRDRGLAQTY